MKSKVKSIVIGLLKYLFAFGIIFWLIESGKINLSTIKTILAPQFLIPCFLFSFLNFYIGSERWRYLLKTQDIILSSFQTLKLSLIGLFFNFAMPGGVGGDLVKGVFITKQFPTKKSVSAMSIFMDRALGLYSMILIATLTMIYDYEHVTSISSLRTLFFIMTAALISSSTFIYIGFTRNKVITQIAETYLPKLPMGKFIYKIYLLVHSYGKSPKIFWNTLAYSLLAQTSTVIVIAIVGNAASPFLIHLKTYFLVVPLGLISTALPLAPAGIGVGQAAFYYLFNVYTQRVSDVGTTSITVFQILTFAFGLVGALFYLLHKSSSTNQNQTNNQKGDK